MSHKIKFRSNVKITKSSTLYDGVDEKTDCYICFGDDIIAYAGKEKPSQSDIEIIAEAVVLIPAFIDAHSHIGMARAGEPEYDDESDEHMESVFLWLILYIVFLWMYFIY
jgi:imidazolonepropionase-like amidohydrolase